MHILYETWIVLANIAALSGLLAIEYGALEGIFIIIDKVMER